MIVNVLTSHDFRGTESAFMHIFSYFLNINKKKKRMPYRPEYSFAEFAAVLIKSSRQQRKSESLQDERLCVHIFKANVKLQLFVSPELTSLHF